MSKTATHSGHCQACGRLQKLPGGVLSKHGYNVTHGFFSGVCVGSGSLPFEQSCELVKTFIVSAQTQLANVEAFQASLRVAATEPVAFFCTSQTNPRGYGYSSVRDWRKCTITETVVTYDGGSYSKFSRNGDTKWVSYRNEFDAVARKSAACDTEVSHDFKSSLLDVATKANATYATWLQHEVDSLRNYIAWQTERVRTWKPAALLPVTTKDKQGFTPVAPAY